jgi:peptidyl-prolyl cis-trans isomerase SurA
LLRLSGIASGVYPEYLWLRQRDSQPGDLRLPSARRFHNFHRGPLALAATGLITFGIALTLSGCHQTAPQGVLATVNGKEILASELDRAYKQSLDPGAPTPAKEEEAIKRLAILHSLIQEEILQQRAATLNLVATNEEVDAKLTDLKAPLTQEEFDRQLKERNQTLDDLRREIRRQLTTNKLMNKEIESKINITDGEISDYYNAHKSEFNPIEPQYRLGRILVTNQPSSQVTNLQNNKAANDTEAKKKIQSLRGRLDTGEDFASVATRFSEDNTSSSNGGDVGFVSESQLQTEPEAFAAISKLKAGQTTDILPISQGEGSGHKTVGYQIFKLIGKQPAGQELLSDPRVQLGIRQQLRSSHSQLLQDAYLEMLYNEAKVHNFLAQQIYKNGAN